MRPRPGPVSSLDPVGLPRTGPGRASQALDYRRDSGKSTGPVLFLDGIAWCEAGLRNRLLRGSTPLSRAKLPEFPDGRPPFYRTGRGLVPTSSRDIGTRGHLNSERNRE